MCLKIFFLLHNYTIDEDNGNAPLLLYDHNKHEEMDRNSFL